MSESDKIPFCQCLLHETKKATAQYVLIIATTIDLFAAIGLVMAVLYYIVTPITYSMISASQTLAGVFGVAFSNAWISTSAYHIPVATVMLVISPPILYALAVCINRRLRGSIYEKHIARGILCTAIGFVASCMISIAADVLYMLCSARHPIVSFHQVTFIVSWGIFIAMAMIITVIVAIVLSENSDPYYGEA